MTLWPSSVNLISHVSWPHNLLSLPIGFSLLIPTNLKSQSPQIELMTCISFLTPGSFTISPIRLSVYFRVTQAGIFRAILLVVFSFSPQIPPRSPSHFHILLKSVWNPPLFHAWFWLSSFYPLLISSFYPLSISFSRWLPRTWFQYTTTVTFSLLPAEVLNFSDCFSWSRFDLRSKPCLLPPPHISPCCSADLSAGPWMCLCLEGCLHPCPSSWRMLIYLWILSSCVASSVMSPLNQFRLRHCLLLQLSIIHLFKICFSTSTRWVPIRCQALWSLKLLYWVTRYMSR